MDLYLDVSDMFVGCGGGVYVMGVLLYSNGDLGWYVFGGFKFLIRFDWFGELVKGW